MLKRRNIADAMEKKILYPRRITTEVRSTTEGSGDEEREL